MTKPPRTEFERRFEAMMNDGLTRRTLVRRGTAGALSISAMAYLAACGSDKLGPRKTSEKVIPKGKIASELVFANWPLYIDVDEKTKKHPTLEMFQKKYGTKVKYIEEINDNNEFFGKVNQQYAQGSSGGRDLHVLTDWMCARMKRLGYVQKLDKTAMPNVVNNIETAVASPDFDPKREFSVPWQSGQVLLIYRKDKIGGDLTSVNELFDPKFKGKVTMLTEMRDTVGSVLLADGVKPEDATLDQVMTAIDKIAKASQDGQIRRFTGNEYTKDILKGDSHAILGWSGDAVQLTADSKNVGYAQPKEGFMIFTDTMQIPVGAPHAYTAEKMMDFVYDPEIQALITAYVNYVPPVKGVKEVLQKSDPELGGSPLIFPDLTNAHNFKTFTPAEETQIDSAFQKAIGA
ncbi:MAG: spermidine/putrescine transport system substrate-binding protein [Thermoleophilaceae bacterium]|nr:spermidine/putrescine transport system substrate-binding protein [Thermoleophilaceae bacterium]MEA2352398.1 spermidine/putrescine transport system substrate-binding protein [Thermoleophilaceae bacterium]MEA2388892.1 spermidine/putrescine transport system substrate-binding protein [Thermoleophilaceae bacterium]